jgi:hypothetical protein
MSVARSGQRASGGAKRMAFVMDAERLRHRGMHQSRSVKGCSALLSPTDENRVIGYFL